MPAYKSARKQLKISRKRHLRNISARSAMKTAIKKVRAVNDSTEAQHLLRNAVSLIDKTIKKGVVHPNTGARYKSKLTRFVNTLA
ncbi:MAG: 30S ribosomal protein S20 [Candidatus Latescibacteria bacterium]|nr:30S ribosomal protein S20 [Candidatus Latescibacterota bacterium]